MTALNVAPIYADAWAKTTFLGLATIVAEQLQSEPTTILGVTCRLYWVRYAFTETNVSHWVDVADITTAPDFPPTPPHNLLSDTHADTTTATPSAHDLLFAISPGNWSRLALGTAGKFLHSGATGLEWAALSGDVTGDSAAALTVANDSHNHTAVTLPVPTSTTPGAAAFTAADFSIASSIVSLATDIARKSIAQLITAAWAFDGADPTTGAAIAIGTTGGTRYPHTQINPDGSIHFGPGGTNPHDTTLARLSAALLQLTGGLNITGGLNLGFATNASPGAIKSSGVLHCIDIFGASAQQFGILNWHGVLSISNYSSADSWQSNRLVLSAAGDLTLTGFLAAANATITGDVTTGPTGSHIGKHTSTDGTAGGTQTFQYYSANSTGTGLFTNTDIYKDGLFISHTQVAYP